MANAVFGVMIIEIINNTRGGIEGKIGERADWGANSSPGCSLIHDVPDKKSRFRRVFLVFKLFFVVRILKISFPIVQDNKTIDKVLFCPQNRQNDLKQL